MSTNIIVNIDALFASIEPWDCSNSVMNLGESAGQITWRNSLELASNHEKWLKSPINEAIEGIREYAGSFGAWDEDEIALWSEEYCLAFLAQDIASDLRLIGSDDLDLSECVAKYNATDWEHESEYPRGSYYAENGVNMCEFYTGC